MLLSIVLFLTFFLLNLMVLSKKYPLSKKIKTIAVFVIATKIILALFMGHFDIYRFIVFIQNWVANPSTIPWDYTLINPEADFPYPPVMLYLHSFFLYFFKGLLNLEPPYLPTAAAYNLIRVPLLTADLLLFYLMARYTKDSKELFFFYLLNPLILFHQYFSGQFDLIALVPFIIGAYLYLEKNKTWPLPGALFFLSLILKPFALLFFPLIYLDGLYSKKSMESLILLPSIMIFAKITEFPYIVSDSYRLLVGAGARVLVSPNPFLFYWKYSFSLFYLLSILALPYMLIVRVKYTKYLRVTLYMTIVTLGFSVLSVHSAGWCIWALPGLLELHRQGKFKISFIHYFWGISFCLRWLAVHHSPIDSLEVFFKFFLKSPQGFKMGHLYYWIEDNYSMVHAEQVVFITQYLFVILSGTMLIKILIVILNSKDQTSLSIRKFLSSKAISLNKSISSKLFFFK